jgi:hypothetical protein
MMAKRPTVNEMMSVASKRLGKTTGASKGSPPPSKGKVKVKPRRYSVKVEFNQKF